MKKFLHALLYLIISLIVLAVSFVGFSVHWGFTTWGDLDINEIIFQLQAPLEGTGNGMIADYVIKGIVPAVIVFAIFVIVLILLKGTKRKLIFIAASLVLSAVAAFAIKKVVWQRLDVDTWLEGQENESFFIEENYVDPGKVKLTFPEKKRNLIMIYLESMETTFMDIASGGDFEENIIPELTELALENEDFSGDSDKVNGGLVYLGTNNTMSALFAHSAGLPLKVEIGTNNLDTQKSFFPKLKTLGDILQDEDYRQIFLLGSNAVFGGRRLYYKEHGDFEIRDYKYAIEQGLIPEDYKVWWGFEDEKLFEYAKDTLRELAAGDQPFNLTMLTVDTHFEDGYVCRLCRDDFGDNQYANTFACSSRQVFDFVRWIQQQDFYENTTIVLTGDHTTMDKDFLQDIELVNDQRVYTAYINAPVEPALKDQWREYCAFDTFPTTLAAMGVTIEGDKLGLGTNLFSGTGTLTEDYGSQVISDEFDKKSTFLTSLESVNKYSEDFVERLRSGMKHSASVEECDPQSGKIPFRFEVPASYTLIDYIDAEYSENKSFSSRKTVRLEADEEQGNVYRGTLDISDWSGTDGKISINLSRSGAVYKGILTYELEDLLQETE